ncbi:hypothetical protein [Alkalicoccobacillus murimartini]|nr:hypothetical protein [Alkalicoccobacillus murimartini]
MMVTIKRGIERKLLIVGSMWNACTALLTIFSYYSWFDQEGAARLESQELNTMIAGSQMVNNILQVIMLFGIFMLIGALINFVVAVKLKDHEIQKGVVIWMVVWGLILIVSMDIIGFLIVLFALVIYLAKNKAIKLSKEEMAHE